MAVTRVGPPVDLGLVELLADPDATVATVGDRTITNRMMHDRLQYYEDRMEERHVPAAQAAEMLPLLRREVLKEMIPRMVVEEVAEADDVVATTPEVEETLARLEQNLRAQNAYEEFLASRGWTPEDLRAAARQEVLVRQLIAKHVRISDASVAEVYELFKAQQTGRADMARARHILFMDPDPATAEAVLARVAAGEDFAALARQFSADTGSAAKGGDLGYFTKGQMVPEFEAAVFALKDGETARELVKSQYGYHIIRREGVAGLDEMRPEIEEYLAQRVEFPRWMQEQQDKMTITFVHPEDDPSWQPPAGVPPSDIE
ncbi:peptidylprolyl isomerase [bacterium]|nr:peptidylprolyl isomerase [bacterium]